MLRQSFFRLRSPETYLKVAWPGNLKLATNYEVKPVNNLFHKRTLISSSRHALTRAEPKGAQKPAEDVFKRSSKRGPVTWASLALCALAGGGLLLYVRHLKEEKERMKEKQQKRSMGKVALGGPFSLIDHNGQAVTDKDFHGKWILLYFGFTHCPDICPDELEKMGKAIDLVGELNRSMIIVNLSPSMSDQERISPCDINKISSIEVTRMN